MNFKVSNTVIIASLVLVVVLIFSIIRGCNNSNKISESNSALKDKVAKLIQDSAKAQIEKRSYQDSLEFKEGELSLSKNMELSAIEALREADAKYEALIKKRFVIIPRKDTDVTAVPNMYIENCDECFAQFSNYKATQLKYKTQKDSQELVYKNIIRLKDNRIGYLEAYTESLHSDLQNVDKAQAKLERRRTLFFTLNTCSFGNALPGGVGAGFVWQDKKGKIFIANAYGTNKGPLYTIGIGIPLSLRKIKN